jgi:hypothetical protein
MSEHELIHVVYIPERPAYQGEHYPSYEEYKRNNSDVWEDEFGEWRLPVFQHMSLEEFESGISEMQVV